MHIVVKQSLVVSKFLLFSFHLLFVILLKSTCSSMTEDLTTPQRKYELPSTCWGANLSRNNSDLQ